MQKHRKEALEAKVIRTDKATRTVKQAMTPNPVVASPDMSIRDLVALLDRHVLPGCPVVDESDQVVGVISRLDLLRGLRPSRELDVIEREAFYTLSVRDLMRYGVVRVDVDDSLATAVDLILDTRVHSLPVVQHRDGGARLVGVVTQGDLVRVLLSDG